MQVQITVTVTINDDGQIRLRHEWAEATDRVDQASMFGIPSVRKLSDEERKDILNQLPGWIISRFRLECDAAIGRVTYSQRTEEPDGQ